MFRRRRRHAGAPRSKHRSRQDSVREIPKLESDTEFAGQPRMQKKQKREEQLEQPATQQSQSSNVRESQQIAPHTGVRITEQSEQSIAVPPSQGEVQVVTAEQSGLNETEQAETHPSISYVATAYQPSTLRATISAMKYLCRYLAIAQMQADDLPLPESAREKAAYITLLSQEILEQLKADTAPYVEYLMDFEFWLIFLHARATAGVGGFDRAAERLARFHADWKRTQPPPDEWGYSEEHCGTHVCRIYLQSPRPSPINRLTPPEVGSRTLALTTLQNTFAAIRRFFPLHGRSPFPELLCLAVTNNLHANAYIRGWYATPR